MTAPLKATFFALRRRERGGVLTRATLVHGLLLLALFVLFAVLVWAIRPTSDAGGDLSMSVGVYGLQITAGFVVLAFFNAVVTASYEAACLRWLIRGETAGFGGFSLGGDTWRIYAGYWIWFAIAFVIWIVALLSAGLLLATLNLLNTGDGAPYEAWGGMVLWTLATSPLAIRMSAGNAVSVAKKKFAYFESWKVSRGRFWALFGSFLIAWLIWIVVLVALFVGAAFLVFVVSSDQPETADPTNVMMSGSTLLAIGAANLALAFLSAGVNARAVIAAAEEAKIEGVGTNVAAVFD
jgi:hypothetical protein